jgi:hypothetical protein
MTAHLILVLLAMVFAGLAAINVSSPPWFKVHWGWLGITIWILSTLV